MSFTRIKLFAQILIMITVFVVPAVCHSEEFKIFTSEEYGFSMKYPATWVKTEPKGNYYVVFQAPDLTDNFRNRIHVAAHKPVKDPLEVFLKELRNGITDLQKQSTDKQQVKIVDEGEYKSEVPRAYYFFIQAYDNKLKIWMDIVIVFYKQGQTLLRISCLAPSQSMEKYQPMFNEVLVSVKFGSQETPSPAVPPRPTEMTPPPLPPTPPSMQPVQPVPPKQPAQPSIIPESVPLKPLAPSPAPRSGPRGPSREPEGPSTGIVN